MQLQQYSPRTGGVVIYNGPSCIDSKPIVVVATLSTANEKTGDMIQTWILRADMHPLDAIRTGDDASICGSCRHRGSNGASRSCYVVVPQAPSNIWRTWRAGKYRSVSVLSGDELQVGWVRGRLIRCGAYGDPAAVPFDLWRRLIEYSVGWTGYTHQWRTCSPEYSQICMASVDSEEEALEARLRGWRTFRVKDPEDAELTGEFICPASAEQGFRKDCATCLACAGTRFGKLHGRAGNVVINVHGSKAKLSAWNKMQDMVHV